MKIVRASVLAAGGLAVTGGGAESERWRSEVQALAEKAQEHYAVGRFKDAGATYEQALKKAPANLYLLSCLGVVQFQAKKYAAAGETLQKARTVGPEDEFARSTLGIFYYLQRKLDRAIDELTKALAINPKSATAHRYMGILAAMNGWTELARKHAEILAILEGAERDSSFRAPVSNPPLGDFLTPLEKNRLKIPPSTYRPVQPPGGGASWRQ